MTGRFSNRLETARAFLDWLRRDSRPLLGFATLVAVIATSGSLYLSLGLGLVPCRLCWYQRILLYPLVVVLGVAFLEGRGTAVRTVLPLSVFGLAVAAYHSILQVSATPGSQCTLGGGGCQTVLLRVYGLSIPNLSLLAFALITVTMVVIVLANRR